MKENIREKQIGHIEQIFPGENSEENQSSRLEVAAVDKNEEEREKEKNEEKEEKSNDSALMKVNRLLLFVLAFCLPVQGQPVKMMLCLPCPPPEGIENCGGSESSAAPKPRDYTYRCESRELRMGNLYSCCQCIKRNGLQDDCPRTPCQGRAACLKKPWPDCWPSGGCHGIDFSREKGTKRYDPCKEQRFDKKECQPEGGAGGLGDGGGGGGGGKSDCGGNMMVVVCPTSGKT